MKLRTPLLQNWLKRFSPTAFLVESVKVQKAPAQRRGPGCLTKVSYMNLQQEAGSTADGGQQSSRAARRVSIVVGVETQLWGSVLLARPGPVRCCGVWGGVLGW